MRGAAIQPPDGMAHPWRITQRSDFADLGTSSATTAREKYDQLLVVKGVNLGKIYEQATPPMDPHTAHTCPCLLARVSMHPSLESICPSRHAALADSLCPPVLNIRTDGQHQSSTHPPIRPSTHPPTHHSPEIETAKAKRKPKFPEQNHAQSSFPTRQAAVRAIVVCAVAPPARSPNPPQP
jgi:hypothetical protein